MPYFHTPTLNLLFIHIPKTGGTSVERYFEKKLDIKLDVPQLYHTCIKYGKIPYQHLPLTTLMTHHEEFGIDPSNLQFITIVRNPYHRMISELAFIKLITDTSTCEEVFVHIYNVITQHSQGIIRNNHIMPQYQFLLDSTEKIPSSITILRTENLTPMMKALGWVDFSEYYHKSTLKRDPMTFLNKASLKLLNIFYAKDFEFFDYELSN